MKVSIALLDFKLLKSTASAVMTKSAVNLKELVLCSQHFCFIKNRFLSPNFEFFSLLVFVYSKKTPIKWLLAHIFETYCYVCNISVKIVTKWRKTSFSRITIFLDISGKKVLRANINMHFRRILTQLLIC